MRLFAVIHVFSENGSEDITVLASGIALISSVCAL